jgi:hypothetical protein
VPEPDFVGVGSAHCGTTWWIRLLLHHPRVDRTAGGHREGSFFAPFAERPMRDRDIAEYHERFAARPGAITGEWSARHLSDVWVAPLLARAAPDARILVLLRDPVERYLSVLNRRGDDAQHMAAVAHSGRYGSQLRSLLACIDRERVLVLQTERCLADTAGELARTLEFLGLDPGELPGDPAQLEPAPDLGLPAVPWPDLRDSLVGTLRPEVALARELAGPDLDLTLWPHFADLATGAMMPTWTRSS